MMEMKMKSDVQSSLPDLWVWTTLQDVGDIYSGGTPSTKNSSYFEGDIPWITPADLSGYENIYISTGKRNISQEAVNSSSAVLIPAGSVLFSSRAPIGYVAIAKNEFTTNQGFKSIKPLGGISSEYIYYYLKTIKDLAEAEASGTTFLEISKTKFERLPLRLAPLPEQHRIVAKVEELFTQLDASEAALKRAKANLERYRRSVLQAAMMGELTKEWRDVHPFVKNASSDVKSTFIERNTKTKVLPTTENDLNGLASLPKEWEWVRIGSILDIKLGGTPSRDKLEYWNGGIPWVSSGEVSFSRIKKTRETISELGLKNSNAKLLPPGTVLLGMIGEGKTRGQSAILEIEACTNQNIAAILCRESPVLPEWLYYWFMYNYENTRKSGSGGMQYALNSERVGNLIFPLPPLQEQHAITSIINLLFDNMLGVEKIIYKNLLRIQKLRQSILEKAFTGQLVVQNPEDEPAALLLRRIQAEREEREKRQKTEKPKKEKKKMVEDNKRKSLIETLHAAGARLTPEELFRRAGFDEESVDEFYEELRGELQVEKDGEVIKKGRIKEDRPDNAKVYLIEVLS